MASEAISRARGTRQADHRSRRAARVAAIEGAEPGQESFGLTAACALTRWRNCKSDTDDVHNNFGLRSGSYSSNWITWLQNLPILSTDSFTAPDPFHLSMNPPSPALRAPSPIRWERAGVRVAVASSWPVSRSEWNRKLLTSRTLSHKTTARADARPTNYHLGNTPLRCDPAAFGPLTDF
jgi:hypothetical protein